MAAVQMKWTMSRLKTQASKTEATCTFATTMCCYAGTTTATTDSPEVAHSSVREAAPLINYVPTDREVHRSKGIAVPKRLYNHPMGLKRQTHFVREAAVTFFIQQAKSVEVLLVQPPIGLKGRRNLPRRKKHMLYFQISSTIFLKHTVLIGKVEQMKKLLNKALANKIIDFMKSKD
ncbi:uncharacterized protein LOC142765665 [Rhipicephalus microplus]|uniref:uncharacterized protein LOC142765665 n=1 Tax=Rhipicephalus microplus TaxID=6941 RepID=UPI003F6B19CC